MNEINIVLSKEESLVLFDLLSRNEESCIFKDGVLDSEKKVFANILCVLEKDLLEPFGKNYVEVLKKARKKVLES